MFNITEDKSIYVTRGDIVRFTVTAKKDGEEHTFQKGDILRLRVFEKKNCEKVHLIKDFPVTGATQEVEIFLEEADTKIGTVISKPTAYWYEIELNPDTYPQTIVGYDDDGPKVFMLYPEGKELTEGELDEGIKGDVHKIIEEEVLKNLPTIHNDMWVIGGVLTDKPARGAVGPSGVYVGSGAMPEGYTVQFDPEGDYVMGEPKIVSGYWHIWNDETGDYVNTGVKATAQGEPGKTPVRGVDYWTDEDKAEMVADVIAALPNGDDVVYPEEPEDDRVCVATIGPENRAGLAGSEGLLFMEECWTFLFRPGLYVSFSGDASGNKYPVTRASNNYDLGGCEQEAWFDGAYVPTDTDIVYAWRGEEATITFHVNGEDFTCAEGITWAQFVYSEYNNTEWMTDCCLEIAPRSFEVNGFDWGVDGYGVAFRTHCGPYNWVVTEDNEYVSVAGTVCEGYYGTLLSGGEDYGTCPNCGAELDGGPCPNGCDDSNDDSNFAWLTCNNCSFACYEGDEYFGGTMWHGSTCPECGGTLFS